MGVSFRPMLPPHPARSRSPRPRPHPLTTTHAHAHARTQAYLGQLTGASTVPRVFVGGACIGGGDDTAAKQRSGELAKLLAAVGAAA